MTNLESTPFIHNHDDYKDKHGLLAKKLVPLNSQEPIYQVHPLATHAEVSISVLNNNPNATIKVRIWASYSTSPQQVDMIETEIELKPNAKYWTRDTLVSTMEIIHVHSSGGSAIVRIEGHEYRKRKGT